jgi:transcriptional regulator with XRE-family HTH domain
MADFDELYRELGRKIRQAREGASQRFSQDALANRLGISRASVVNIEGGRQRAPLHLLWQIAELVGTDLTLLIPTREELVAPESQVELDRGMMKQIREVANGDPGAIKLLTGFVSKLKSTTEKSGTDRKLNEHTNSRRKS